MIIKSTNGEHYFELTEEECLHILSKILLKYSTDNQLIVKGPVESALVELIEFYEKNKSEMTKPIRSIFQKRIAEYRVKY